MIKRRTGDRADWKRIIEKEYAQMYIEVDEFKGYVTLLKLNKVHAPLKIKYNEKNLCIVNNGYQWLQHIPILGNHSVTTMFNEKGEIIQWYIDICLRTGETNGIPWFDDLFLDIIVLPSGEVVLLDEDELEEALANRVIDHVLYDLAYEEANKLLKRIKEGNFPLFPLTYKHRDELCLRLENGDS